MLLEHAACQQQLGLGGLAQLVPPGAANKSDARNNGLVNKDGNLIKLFAEFDDIYDAAEPDMESTRGRNARIAWGEAHALPRSPTGGAPPPAAAAHTHATADADLDDVTSLFAVFDGGDAAAFCAHNLREAVLRSSAYVTGGDLGEALREALLLLDEEAVKRGGGAAVSPRGGAPGAAPQPPPTATLVALRGNTLTVAGVGDNARCVVARAGGLPPLRLTAAGGYLPHHPHPQGDAAAAAARIAPGALRMCLDGSEPFLLLACDAVWRSLPSDADAVALVAAQLAEHGDPALAAAQLVARCCGGDDDSSSSNASAVVVLLDGVAAAAACGVSL